jgi:hypothetical protein
VRIAWLSFRVYSRPLLATLHTFKFLLPRISQIIYSRDCGLATSSGKLLSPLNALGRLWDPASHLLGDRRRLFVWELNRPGAEFRKSGAPTPALPHFGFPLCVRSRDSSVGIATRYGVDGPGIESRGGARFSSPVQTHPEGGRTRADKIAVGPGSNIGGTDISCICMVRQYTGPTGQSYREDHRHVGVMPATPSINTPAWCAEQVRTRLPCHLRSFVASLEKICACSFVRLCNLSL